MRSDTSISEPSGEVLRLVMEEPLVWKDPVRVGADASVPVSFEQIDTLRSDAAIVTALDSTDEPILVSGAVLDYVRSDWQFRSDKLRRRVFSPNTGPTALRDDQGQIGAVAQLRSAYYSAWSFDELVNRF